jgi:hypothetical protein
MTSSAPNNSKFSNVVFAVLCLMTFSSLANIYYSDLSDTTQFVMDAFLSMVFSTLFFKQLFYRKQKNQWLGALTGLLGAILMMVVLIFLAATKQAIGDKANRDISNLSDIANIIEATNENLPTKLSDDLTLTRVSVSDYGSYAMHLQIEGVNADKIDTEALYVHHVNSFIPTFCNTPKQRALLDFGYDITLYLNDQSGEFVEHFLIEKKDCITPRKIK